MNIDINKLFDKNEIEIKEDVSNIDEVLEYEQILLSISKTIAQYRNDNNLTQKELAEILENNQVIPATQLTKEPVKPNIAEERNNLPAVRKQGILDRIRRNIRKRLYRNFNETGIHVEDCEIR